MDQRINNILTEYIKLLKKQFAGVEHVYLFGSYAKGNITEDSDIDIAVIFEFIDESEKFDLQVELMLLAAEVDSRIEPHPISNDEFISGNPFVFEIKKTGIELAA